MAKLEDLSCLKTLKYIQLRNLDTCINTVKLSFVNLGWQSLTSVMSIFICMLAVLGGSPLSTAIITSSWAESCQPIINGHHNCHSEFLLKINNSIKQMFYYLVSLYFGDAVLIIRTCSLISTGEPFYFLSFLIQFHLINNLFCIYTVLVLLVS